MASDQAWTGLPDELREDALDVLRDAREWRLPGARWDSVVAEVRSVAAALVSMDIEAVRRAVYNLELAGPVRAIPVGATPVGEPPEPVRDEINELIHTLDGRATSEQ
jgi:hypothetical protein